ncbi:hypothetical protein [Bosea sp. RAC05]|uniref:hypothetical protein n=1 Tax=Bosea sp. RAC05 TaxID=1842539 RepID=UPI00123795AC|nr:hypothetical protein [Bosea sp. RAC05]
MTTKRRSSIRRKKHRPSDSISFMVLGFEDRDVVYERVIIPAKFAERLHEFGRDQLVQPVRNGGKRAGLEL